MDRYRFHDVGQSSTAERTCHHTDDVIRRQASSSRRNDAESSTQPIEKPHIDEIEVARVQAIEKGKAKMQKYQQEAKRYQNEDRDTFEEFVMDYQNNPVHFEEYVVEFTSKNSYGEYENIIDIKNGKITGVFNMHVDYITSNKLHFSEIVFNQLYFTLECLNMEISEFNLKCWYANEVIDEETDNTVNLFFPEERDVDGSVKQGKKTFIAGTDAFIALAGTPTGQSKFYLLAQHPKAFPRKEVTSITVIRYYNVEGILRTDIEYKFGSKSEQKEKASPNGSL
jgi:hypothetical protein